MQNRRLTERMQQLQEENNYLIQNAEQEISKMSDFIDRYTDRQRQKREELKKDYEAKLE